MVINHIYSELKRFALYSREYIYSKNAFDRPNIGLHLYIFRLIDITTRTNNLYIHEHIHNNIIRVQYVHRFVIAVSGSNPLVIGRANPLPSPPEQMYLYLCIQYNMYIRTHADRTINYLLNRAHGDNIMTRRNPPSNTHVYYVYVRICAR